MRTWKILGRLSYDKGRKSVIESWEGSTFDPCFSISSYMGILRRVITRTRFILALAGSDKTFGRKNPRFKTYNKKGDKVV